jgi:hypothetical protein
MKEHTLKAHQKLIHLDITAVNINAPRSMPRQVQSPPFSTSRHILPAHDERGWRGEKGYMLSKLILNPLRPSSIADGVDSGSD